MDRKLKEYENIFFGGAKGGGKSMGMRQVFLKWCIENPGLKAAIFRKTFPELYENHISKMQEAFPQLTRYYSAGHKQYVFPNGSVLAFRYNQHEKDLSNHQGVEYQLLGIEEAGEWPEDWFWKLKGSNRSSNPALKPRCLLTGNPGGIGHNWLKRLFVDRQYREGIELPEDYYFIPAFLADNPALLEADPNYKRRLMANKNRELVKAYLEGSWDIQAGQFFDSISRSVHMIKPFKIPDHWERMGMFDTGYNHPAAFIWMTMDEDGNCYVYREYCESKRRTEEIVSDIMKFEDTKDLMPVVAGHDCWTKHSGDPSVEEKFREASEGKINLTKASIERVPGAEQLRDYLAHSEKQKPRLYFFDTCPLTFDAVSRMVVNPSKVEDVLKVDASNGDNATGDDLYDCLRYGVMARPKISYKPVEKRRRRYYDDDDGDDGGNSSWTTV